MGSTMSWPPTLETQGLPSYSPRLAVLRVQAGKAQDLPVYFGDAGSPGVLHSIGAHKAACAVITLDAPGAPRPPPTLHAPYDLLKWHIAICSSQYVCRNKRGAHIYYVHCFEGAADSFPCHVPYAE